MKRSAFASLVVLLALLSSPPVPVYAGNGTLEGGKLNLSVMFSYQEGDVDAWRPVFEEASRLLWNATNGQVQIGRIRVLGCGTDKENADIWIRDDHSGAFANVLGLGGMGHIYLSQVHKSDEGAALGQFGIAHEIGHYVFGLYDEYKGVPAPPRDAAEQTFERVPFMYCTTDDDPLACMMDGGSTVAPNNRRTEFCTSAHGGLGSDHNDGTIVGDSVFVNAQQALNGESCWETIARTTGLFPPDEVQPGDPPGLEPIDWEIVPGIHRVVFAIDASASMFSNPDKERLEKRTASVLIDLLHGERLVDGGGGQQVLLPGEHVALTAFAGGAAEILPFSELVDRGTKDAYKAAIEGIVQQPIPYTDALDTNLGSALQDCIDRIAREGEIPACGEAVVLLSDGLHTTGVDPLSLVEAYRERGVRIHTIAVGPGADVGLLEELAAATDGEFHVVAADEDIFDATSSISKAIRQLGTLKIEQGQTDGQDEHLPFTIDAYAEEVTTVLQWDQGDLDLVLTSPSGESIDVETGDPQGDIEAYRESGVLYIRIAEPEAGLWDAWIVPREVPGTINYEMRVLDENQSVQVTAATDRAEYVRGEPIRLRVDVIATVPVAGTTVQGTIIPAGNDPRITDRYVFPVFDDGDPAHGDEWAGDGVYNTVFAGALPPGQYDFRIWALNETGSGPDPDLPFVEDGAVPPLVVPPFSRKVDLRFRVRDTEAPLRGEATVTPSASRATDERETVACAVAIPKTSSDGGADAIDMASVRLQGIPAAAIADRIAVDADPDGRHAFRFVLSAKRLAYLCGTGMERTLRVDGRLAGGRAFSATAAVDVVRATTDILRPRLVSLGSGGRGGFEVAWTRVDVGSVVYDGYATTDDGTTYRRLFEGVDGDHYVWGPVHARSSGTLRVLVQARTREGVLLQELSPLGRALGSSATGTAEDALSAPVPAMTEIVSITPVPSGPGPTAVRYTIARATSVRLDVYDAAGRLVRALVSDDAVPGRYEAVWDLRDEHGSPAAAGVYIAVLRAGETRSQAKLIVAR